MTAEFYLLDRSFRYTEDLTPEELENKIYSLFLDYEYIRQYDEFVYKNESIYDEEIYPDVKLWEFLYDDNKSALFDKDYRKYLGIIIDRSSPTELEIEDVVGLLDTHDESNIYGLICLHRIADVDEKYLVYDRNDWFDFHRHFLGLYPVSESRFYSESTKYFNELFFHPEVENSLHQLEGGLAGFSKTIVRCLSKLNDILPECWPDRGGKLNLPDILRTFSSKTGIETTLEGNIDRKEDLTFEFDTLINGQSGTTERIRCEPHMKISRSDNYPGDSKHYFNRIYFHPGKDHVHDGRILICHIGKHL